MESFFQLNLPCCRASHSKKDSNGQHQLSLQRGSILASSEGMMLWITRPIVSMTNRIFVKNAEIVWVMGRIVVLTTDKTSARIQSTGQKTE